MKHRISRAAGLTTAALAGALIVPGGASGFVDGASTARGVGDPAVVTITEGPAALGNADAVTFKFTVTDGSAPVVTCDLDGVPLDACDPDGTTVDTPYDGQHTFTVAAADPGGDGSDSWTYEIDRSAPHATFAGPPPVTPGDRSPTFAAQVDADVALYHFVITDDLTGAVVRSQRTSASTFTPLPLPDGDFTVTLSGVDAAGNESPVATRESQGFSIDGTPPAVAFAGDALPDGARTNATDVVLEFDADEYATYTCALDGAAPVGCAAFFELSNLLDGEHELEVTATDSAGNSATITRSFAVDTVTPTVRFTAPAEGQVITTRNATLVGTASTGAHDLRTVDVGVGVPGAQMGGPDATVTLVDGTWSLTTRDLPNGRYVASAVQFDQAGNADVTRVAFEVAVPAGAAVPPAVQPPRPPVQLPAAPAASVVKAALGTTAARTAKVLGATPIQALLSRRSVAATFAAPGAGTVSIRYTTQVVRVVRQKGKSRRTVRTVVVGTGSTSVAAAGSAKVQVKLTAAGRKVLKRAKRLPLTVSSSFVAKGAKAAQTATSRTTVRRTKGR